jgi:hypothetical protein
MVFERAWVEQGGALAGLIADAVSPSEPEAGRQSPWPTAADQRCVGCGYGIAATRIPDRCPMCGGRSWRAAGGRPVLVEVS